MSEITYLGLNQVNIDDLLSVLNDGMVREHLIEHDKFDHASIQQWIKGKLEVDSLPACRVRAVIINGELAGWCGLQPDESGIELAIVISHKFWGKGITIFKTLMRWAKELGHKKVLFHLLDTRPEYETLKKIAAKVKNTELMGRSFLTYYVALDEDTYKKLTR